jgi:trehalose-phosphatase
MHNYVRLVLAQEPCALCLDIDGTISATAPTVDAAVLLPGMRDLLIAATTVFDLVATISGRAVADQRRMIGVPGVWHVGHHGYEWEELDTTSGVRRTILLPEAAPYLANIESALDEIEVTLSPHLPGLWMERKGITGGVHWRLAEDHAAAETLAMPVVIRIAHAYSLRVRASKLAVELYSPILADKGIGLDRLIESHGLHGAIYIGDDVSDTDAFRLVRSKRQSTHFKGTAVAVLHQGSSPLLQEISDLVVSDVTQVPGLVRWLLTTRRHSGHSLARGLPIDR